MRTRDRLLLSLWVISMIGVCAAYLAARYTGWNGWSMERQSAVAVSFVLLWMALGRRLLSRIASAEASKKPPAA